MRKTHGATIGGEPPEYRAWKQAKIRCLSPSNPDYRYYGGRGITFCDEWANDYSAFLRDMGPRPAGHTLDRIDVNGPYAPGNCRWATRAVQSNNTRQCHYVDYQGQRMTMAEAAHRAGVDYQAMRIRIRTRGQTAEQAIYALQHGRKSRKRPPE